MKVITHQGKDYACPFSEAIPRHTADERARMDENTEFVYPVLLYLDTDTGRNLCVLDGEGRLESAARTGAAVEFRHLGPLPTARARELAERIENDRRHEKPEAIRRRREERLKRVAEARAEGKSTRQIADELGVSQSQVVKDLKECAEHGCSPGPETVTGKDGVQQPAKKKGKKKAAEPDDDDEDEEGGDEPEDTKAGAGTVAVDFGTAADARKLADSLLRLVKRLRAGVSCLLGSLHGEAVRNVFTAHSVTALTKTGETVELGTYGGVVRVGPPEWSCLALDELGGQLAAASLVLERIEREPPPPANGEAVPLPWEQLVEGEVPL